MITRKRALTVNRIPTIMAQACLNTERILEMDFMKKIFADAVQSVLPQKLVRQQLVNFNDNLVIGNKIHQLKNNIHLVGFGKAVLGMASEVEKILGEHIKSGILCVPKNTTATFKQRPEFQLKNDSVIKIFEGAAFNLPDNDALIGANAIIEKVKSLSESDILLVLISGGGSSLLPKPRDGISLDDKLTTLKLLASSGATINELNTVRKKLSLVKGGGLAVLSYPVKTICLILSDVVNNPLDIIASGPTVPNTDKQHAALEILKKYKLLDKVPENVLKIAKENFSTPCIPTQTKGFSHVDNYLIGSNLIAIQNAKNSAERLGYRTIVLSSKINSSIYTISDLYVNLSFEILKLLYTEGLNEFMDRMSYMLRTCHYDFPNSLVEDIVNVINLKGFFKGICIIAGGETTVNVSGDGIGGRNQELSLMFSQKMMKLKQANMLYFQNYDISFMSAGTDGIDGNSTAAGAISCTNLLARAVANYVDPGYYLSINDSNTFFKVADGGVNLIETGHTGTNVMDLHVIAIHDINYKSER